MFVGSSPVGSSDDEWEVTEALARAFGLASLASAAVAQVTDLRRLSGGASRETWAFNVDLGDGTRPMILQRSRGGAPTMGGPSMADEDLLVAAAERAGVPVPPVVLTSRQCGPFLGDARVTAFVDGEALGPRIVRSERFAPARRLLVAQCARALAAIHSIDPGTVPGLAVVDPVDRLREGLDLLDERRPAFEVALRWLADNRPPARPSCLVHGDFRIGNLLVDPEAGLVAVLDWELAHLGDPLEDLGWLCVRAWRFGGEGEVGGVGALSDLIDTYAEATGSPVDLEHIRWWIVAGTLTWGLICAVQARRHLDGSVRSVELATIGRRVVETEYDLCQLLAIGTPSTERATAETVLDDIERPTAAELLEAVRIHLSDQVVPSLDGAAAFQLKVAGNALAVVERELRFGPAAAARVAEILSPLGLVDERGLARATRAGDLDGSTGAVGEAVRALVVERLRISNPRWLQPADA